MASRSSSPSRSACTTACTGIRGMAGALGAAEHASFERVAGARTSPTWSPGSVPATSCCCTTRRRRAWSTGSGRPACGSCGAATSAATPQRGDGGGMGVPPALRRTCRRLRVLASASTCPSGWTETESSSSHRRSTRSRPRTAIWIRTTVEASWRRWAWSRTPRPSAPSPSNAATARSDGSGHTPASSPTERHRLRTPRLIVQVSRWDRLKDMAGVLTGFTRMAADGPTDTHLVLAGPDVSGVTDDPEGAAVLTECRERWRSLPEPDARSRPPRVHPDGRRRRERHHRQRLAAPRRHGRAEEPRRGLRSHRHRGDVEGASGDRQSRRRHPGPDHRRARRAAGRRSPRPRCAGDAA